MAKPYRASYTPEEDATILAYCKEAQAEGATLKTAHIALADKLERPVGSVSNRYNRLIKKVDGGVLKGATDGEMLVVRLKALAREKERNAEKSDHYKEMYRKLQNEHDDLKRQYKALQQEHQKLIDTVKEALGENEEESE